MDQSLKHTEWEKSYTGVHTVWFHFYEGLEQGKLIYGEKKKSTVVNWWEVCGWTLTGKGNEGNFCSNSNIVYHVGKLQPASQTWYTNHFCE